MKFAKVLLIFLLILVVTNLDAFFSDSYEFTLKNGQGGFNDKRSDLNKLGGGQLAVEFQYLPIPLALSLSGEYYTNSANPTHLYEISDLTAINLLYILRPINITNIKLYAGGGFGLLKAPVEGVPNRYNKNWLGNIEAGVSYRLFWKLGVYSTYKYLYSKKKEDNMYVIDFHEHIILIGIQLSFKI